MIAALVVLTFLAAVLIDHLLHRGPIPVVAELPKHVQRRPRLTPAVVAGFAVPDNLLYHPGHTWAASEGGDMVRVGIDDFAAKLTGEAAAMDIPERGQWIRQGQRIISMRKDGRKIELVSPIEGTVVDVNQAALDNPRLAHEDPYGDGWLLSVNSPDARTNFRNLLGGNVARRWMDEAAARLRAVAVPAGAMAQDGGLAVDSMLDQLPNADWEQLAKEFFLS